jgi:hypothetical protein
MGMHSSVFTMDEAGQTDVIIIGAGLSGKYYFIFFTHSINALLSQVFVLW